MHRLGDEGRKPQDRDYPVFGFRNPKSAMNHVETSAAPMPAILAEVQPAVLPRPALVENHRGFAWISDKICGIIEEPTPRWWWVCFIVAAFVASFTVEKFGLERLRETKRDHFDKRLEVLKKICTI